MFSTAGFWKGLGPKDVYSEPRMCTVCSLFLAWKKCCYRVFLHPLVEVKKHFKERERETRGSKYNSKGSFLMLDLALTSIR